MHVQAVGRCRLKFQHETLVSAINRERAQPELVIETSQHSGLWHLLHCAMYSSVVRCMSNLDRQSYAVGLDDRCSVA
ncbi:hypothetical protein WJX79_006971 [Trebouxia sp. C0005]